MTEDEKTEIRAMVFNDLMLILARAQDIARERAVAGDARTQVVTEAYNLMAEAIGEALVGS